MTTTYVTYDVLTSFAIGTGFGALISFAVWMIVSETKRVARQEARDP